jgi:hypothetical protein
VRILDECLTGQVSDCFEYNRGRLIQSVGKTFTGAPDMSHEPRPEEREG